MPGRAKRAGGEAAGCRAPEQRKSMLGVCRLGSPNADAVRIQTAVDVRVESHAERALCLPLSAMQQQLAVCC